MINRITLLLPLLSISFSQEIIGEGLSGQPLLDYVVENYKTSTTLGYNNARDTLYSTIDLQVGDQLSCVYSGYTITLDTTQDPSTNAYNQGINCEHTYPQSMGASEEPQKSDMHHLFPCKSNVNSSRGNDPYAEIPDEETDTWYRNDYSQDTIPIEYIEEFAEKDNPPDPNNEVFEPREDHKGNASRAVFYFYAMYNEVADTNFWNVQKDILLDWHYYEPVDDWELNRTWAIASYQENQPNPFVLDSSLARRIWYMDDGGTDTSTTDTTEYHIIINEIMQNPSAVSDDNGEWFEIYNNSDEEIDLNGFTIKDNDTDSHLIIEETLIASYSYAVLGRDVDSTANGGVSLDYQYEGIALANGADEIVLIDPYGNTVDSVAYDGGNTFPDPNGATMALLEISLDNTFGGNWIEYDSLTYGDGDYGTPGEPNFLMDIEWVFNLSDPVITIFGDDNEWNPEDTISIEMELCNNTDYDHMYYPGAILEADSNLVTIMNQNWFYGMLANTCDTLDWVVIADTDITENIQVDFLAYPSTLGCDDAPEYCIDGDSVYFSVEVIIESLCDSGYIQIGESCYWQEDVDIIQAFIDNSQGSSNPPPINMFPIELGYQEWEEGRLVSLCVSPEIDGCEIYTLGGNIPENIGHVSELENLTLGSNELSGNIPQEIGNLTNLVSLKLYNNQLTGSIPSEISNLTNLIYLLLNDNQLTGEIPESICDLDINWNGADDFNISNNQLCPPYPSCIEDYVGEQDTSNCEPLNMDDFQIPNQYSLKQNYPNPFNPVTIIQYGLPNESFVRISIYDLKGRLVTKLVNKKESAGYKTIRWYGMDGNSKPVSAGIYLYEIQAGNFKQFRKMALVK